MHFVICDLFFGDSGKGSYTSWLTKEHKSQLTIKYCGGSQCSHAVVREDNVHHLFSQFGSGTFHGAGTYLSKHFIFNPISLYNESKVLSDKGISYPLDFIYIDERALLTTSYHICLNRIRELSRGKSRHGSVGLGIWETVLDSENRPEEVIRAGDLQNKKLCLDKLKLTQNYCKNEIERIISNLEGVELDKIKETYKTILIPPEDMLDIYLGIRQYLHILNKNQTAELIDDKNLIFEPGQGVMLDIDYGFAPYISASKTTTQNAREFIKEFDIQGEKEYIGLGRGHLSRHGPGPMITEIESMKSEFQDNYNLAGQYQGSMRYGIFDIPLAEYALSVGQVDYLALSHLDIVEKYNKWPVCREYRGFSYPKFCPTFEQWSEISKQMMGGIDYVVKNLRPNDFIPYLEENLQTKVKFGSFGPKDSQKKVLF